MATQFQIDNARLNRGRKRNGRAPDMATEAFSALVTVLLRHGVAEQQLLEHLADAYRLYKVPVRWIGRRRPLRWQSND